MDVVAEKLEALISCAENALNSIEVQFETELMKQFGVQINPVLMFSAIEDSKKELAELKTEVANLGKSQEEAMEQLTEKVQATCKQIQSLEKKLGNENRFSSNADSVMKSHLRM